MLSLAGNWVRYISIPVFQFLFLNWLWRYLSWIMLLYRISRMKLNLQPTHPDGSGGLGIIMLAQRSFILLFVVFGIVISSGMTARLVEDAGSFDTIRVELTGFIILCIILVLFPLLFFSRKLVDVKTQGKLDLGKAGSNLSKKFEGGWVDPLRVQERIADIAVDPSMHYDYSGLYILLQDMRIIPLRFTDIFIMALMFFLPFVPLFFIHFSIVELLEKLVGMLL